MITDFKSLMENEAFRTLVRNGGTQEEIEEFLKGEEFDAEAIKEDIRATAEKARKNGTRELSDEELNNINGGVDFGDVMYEIGYGIKETALLLAAPEISAGVSMIQAGQAIAGIQNDPMCVIEALPFGRWIRSIFF
ncbi:MAG: bacteriocin [Spirochaetales bacterium]|nr:bacteriocin [Candidatus Physcosoma equi]